ncbi:LemA family protein [Neisseria flavescens]|uniref:LemA family protein n=1 Tax=Neisseria flavescens TaxID=484 RepID=UPI0024B0BEC3|nr:LemA family protein [Neisseria flavescens]
MQNQTSVRSRNSIESCAEKLQTAVNGLLKQYPDEQLAGLMEMLDAAEAEVASARRTYNRRAGSYNHHLNKLPNRLVAKPLGFDKQARLVRFTENQTQRMSSNMLA